MVSNSNFMLQQAYPLVVVILLPRHEVIIPQLCVFSYISLHEGHDVLVEMISSSKVADKYFATHNLIPQHGETYSHCVGAFYSKRSLPNYYVYANVWEPIELTLLL